MPPDPLKNPGPDQTVKVLPRHLAGPGPADPRTAWPFPFDEDWTLRQSEHGTVLAVSPCLRLWTSLLHESGTSRLGTWTIAANRVPFGPAAWQITFDATTPVELVRDVHTELLDLYLEDLRSDQDHLFGDTTPAYEAYAPLFAQGWGHSVRTDGTQVFQSWDGLAGVRHRYAATGSDGLAWRAWGGHLSEPLWQARFSTGTPTALVARFTASLISTVPLHRAVTDTPSRFRRHLYLTTPTPKPAPGTPPAGPPTSPGAGRTR
ncbi:DUF317 domain-containing protein [Streptomyces niveus]|uniref:DUF317 domain-containing protein n=1 Tax=Streptomyces niveus TaxID=193462 RepID=UPI0003C5FFCA|nr:DUF317 domain-containing protein [Streptomyces niveus]EST31748.1 hypothetical protein M877_06320 [Streptomyces niveus NCIMB 11891]